MPLPKLLYYEILNYHPEVLKMMRRHFEVVTLQDPSRDEDYALGEIDVLLAPLGYAVDAAKMARCPNLKVIASSTLSIPHIDAVQAAANGIKLCWLSSEHKTFLNTITPTAELCWGMIIALTRKIPWAHKAACRGDWNSREFGKQCPWMLSKMSLGIVGLGRLGTIVASYGRSFGMPVFYYSPHTRNMQLNQCHGLLELASCADIVSIHAHHTPQTEKMIGKEFIHAMRPGSYLINTARGGIIDESALLEGLESGHLAGAGLDVLADEYEPDFKTKLKENPLVAYARSHENLILTPHYAGATVDAWMMTQMKILELIQNELSGLNL